MSTAAGEAQSCFLGPCIIKPESFLYELMYFPYLVTAYIVFTSLQQTLSKTLAGSNTTHAFTRDHLPSQTQSFAVSACSHSRWRANTTTWLKKTVATLISTACNAQQTGVIKSEQGRTYTHYALMPKTALG